MMWPCSTVLLGSHGRTDFLQYEDKQKPSSPSCLLQSQLQVKEVQATQAQVQEDQWRRVNHPLALLMPS